MKHLFSLKVLSIFLGLELLNLAFVLTTGVFTWEMRAFAMGHITYVFFWYLFWSPAIGNSFLNIFFKKDTPPVIYHEDFTPVSPNLIDINLSKTTTIKMPKGRLIRWTK